MRTVRTDRTAVPRLLLITASSPEIQRVRRSRVLNFQQITMPYLAARVPRDWQVIHVDEEAETLNWNLEADLVGITFHTPSANHAYNLAAHFRRRGACVAMGGPHRSEEHTSELQSLRHLVCRLL